MIWRVAAPFLQPDMLRSRRITKRINTQRIGPAKRRPGSWRPNISAALAWARQRFPFTDVSCTAVRPWGRVLALHSDDGMAYLKCVAKERRREIAITRFVNSISCHSTGLVIDDDVRSGYLLTRGNEAFGGGVDLMELMERYALIQLESDRHRDACTILPVSRPVEQLTTFVKTATSRAVTSNRDTFAKRRYARIAMKIGRSVALRRYLRGGVTLLEHGDLHPGNIVRDPSRRLRIIDWADATLAPVGTSLPFLPLGPRMLGRSLHRSGVTDYIDCYIDLLSKELQIRRSKISKIMISGSISGVVGVANEMAASNWQAYRYRRFSKKLLIACYEAASSLARSLDVAL